MCSFRRYSYTSPDWSSADDTVDGTHSFANNITSLLALKHAERESKSSLDKTSTNSNTNIVTIFILHYTSLNPGGRIWEVDPGGNEPFSEPITLGRDGGNFESFAYDVREKARPRFFVTEDLANGPLRRFTPNNPNWNRPQDMLHGSGVTEYLVLDGNAGTFWWTLDINEAMNSAEFFYPNAEVIDVYDGLLYFVSKLKSELFTLNLDSGTNTAHSTRGGLFDGGPDQLTRLLNKDNLLYFTEDGGGRAGVHGRNAFGEYFTILESPFLQPETTGLAFSPDSKRMYVAYQVDGILFEITREDGLEFGKRSLGVQYHHIS